jgi:hypothetical protein
VKFVRLLCSAGLAGKAILQILPFMDTPVDRPHEIRA